MCDDIQIIFLPFDFIGHLCCGCAVVTLNDLIFEEDQRVIDLVNLIEKGFSLLLGESGRVAGHEIEWKI